MPIWAKALAFVFSSTLGTNSVLLFVVSAKSDDINKDVKVLINELKLYNPGLLDKKMLLAISKLICWTKLAQMLSMKEIDVPIPIFYFWCFRI